MTVYKFVAMSPFEHCGETIVVPKWEAVTGVPETYVQLAKWLQEHEEENGYSFWQIKREGERDFYEFIPYTDDLFFRTRLEINEFGDFQMGYVNAGWAEKSAEGKRYTGRVEPKRWGDMPLDKWEFIGTLRTYEFIGVLAKQFKKEKEAYDKWLRESK